MREFWQGHEADGREQYIAKNRFGAFHLAAVSAAIGIITGLAITWMLSARTGDMFHSESSHAPIGLSNGPAAEDYMQMISSNSTSRCSCNNSDNIERAGTNGKQPFMEHGLESIQIVAEEAMPSIVSVTNDYTVPGNRKPDGVKPEGHASGSGIIVGKRDLELLVATNQHVVAGADSLRIRFIDGTESQASLKGVDEEADIAVLSVPYEGLGVGTVSKIKVAELGDSSDVAPGQPVLAIGNALGYGQSATFGIISATRREVKLDNGSHEFMQTDAAINPGNSGGALLDMEGRVIGINEAKLTGDDVEGMGYTIPISDVKVLLEKLMSMESRKIASKDERGFLGIAGITVTNDMAEGQGMPQGIFVTDILEGGAANEYGFEQGDIITAFDEQRVQTVGQLKDVMKYYRSGDEVTVIVMDNPNGDGYISHEAKVLLGSGMEESFYIKAAREGKGVVI